MKKVFVICFFALLGMTNLNAQSFSDNIRPWEQGKLTWNDFSRQQARPGMHSELRYFLQAAYFSFGKYLYTRFQNSF